MEHIADLLQSLLPFAKFLSGLGLLGKLVPSLARALRQSPVAKRSAEKLAAMVERELGDALPAIDINVSLSCLWGLSRVKLCPGSGHEMV